MNSMIHQVDSFRLLKAAKIEKRLPRHKQGEKFLKGPIPFSWLGKAMRLPGKAVHVAIVIWHLAEMNYSSTISLSNALLRELGVKRNAGYDGLAALEKEGLVVVDRHSGRNSMVTILDTDAARDAAK